MDHGCAWRILVFFCCWWAIVFLSFGGYCCFDGLLVCLMEYGSVEGFSFFPLCDWLFDGFLLLWWIIDFVNGLLAFLKDYRLFCLFFFLCCCCFCCWLFRCLFFLLFFCWRTIVFRWWILGCFDRLLTCSWITALFWSILVTFSGGLVVFWWTRAVLFLFVVLRCFRVLVVLFLLLRDYWFLLWNMGCFEGLPFLCFWWILVFVPGSFFVMGYWCFCTAYGCSEGWSLFCWRILCFFAWFLFLLNGLWFCFKGLPFFGGLLSSLVDYCLFADGLLIVFMDYGVFKGLLFFT